MPVISLSEAPTAPALGKPSSVSLGGGYLSSELTPFVSTGGQLRGQDPNSLSIAGGYGSRLANYMFLKGGQQDILSNVRMQQLNDYVNARLSEGFVKVGPSRLEKVDGSVVTDLDIDWNTGDVNAFTSQLRSGGGGGTVLSRGTQNILGNTGGGGSGMVSNIIKNNTSPIFSTPNLLNTAKTPSGYVSIAGGQAAYDTLQKATGKTTPTPATSFSQYVDITGSIGKILGKTSAPTMSPVSALTGFSSSGSGFAQALGKAAPVSSNKGTSFYGGGTSAPSSASVTKNTSGGFNIKL